MTSTRPCISVLVTIAIAIAIATALVHLVSAQDAGHAALASEFGTYDGNGLPFFGQTLDARGLGEDPPTGNLTPRGIILHLGHGYHACFDPDLLRIALIWREAAPGDYLTMNGMAPGSYRQPHRKAPAGQNDLPTPLGMPLVINGLYPGVQLGPMARFDDPRPPSLDEAEPGRGPLPTGQGRWIGLRLEQDGPVLVYEIAGTGIEDRLRATREQDSQVVEIRRSLRIGPHDKPLSFILTNKHAFTIEPSDQPESWVLRHWPDRSRKGWVHEDGPSKSDGSPPERRPVSMIWKAEVRVEALNAPEAEGPFAIEAVPLPLPNQWKRNVRPSDFDFFPDGRLALVTFDGDVWIAEGVEAGRREIVWRRFAGGLHEPMAIRVVADQLIVFDRNGLVRLVDQDGNGECDFYENFSNLDTQTAETREFAMGFELKPGGGYYLAKGGQVAATRGKHNGTLLELSPDGRKLEVVATGLRQPFLGVDPKSGLLTASDQQGHWKPATPIHVIQPGDYYGFQPEQFGPDANRGREIVEPALWIPHFVNQSAARQVWLRDAKMGALNDCLIHLGYNRPALFKVILEDDHAQGAIVPVLEDFPTGLLSGRVNPHDGILYVGGLNLWGTVGKNVQGLFRIRPTGIASWIPREVRSFAEGVLLRFDQPLDPALATNLANYTVDRWDYRRSQEYGSGHYKLNGEPGQETLALSCVYLSTDRQSVFLGLPDMQPVHSLRVTYRSGSGQIQSAYLTVHHLHPVALAALGFSEPEVDLTPGTIASGLPHPEPSAEEGRKTAELYGCVACHSVDGSQVIAEDPTLVVGPSWKGLYGSEREFTDGTVLKKADEVYLRESILDPSRNVVKGFETKDTGVGMPSYLGVLRDDQIESIILYLKSLK